jgi:hypothetical protein
MTPEINKAIPAGRDLLFECRFIKTAEELVGPLKIALPCRDGYGNQTFLVQHVLAPLPLVRYEMYRIHGICFDTGCTIQDSGVSPFSLGAPWNP